MVKQNSSGHVEYKMRTSYSGPMNSARPNPYNHVQVAHSNGCCSSKKPSNVPSRQHTQTFQPTQAHRQTAHERSHLKLDSPDPFYSRYGRIKKTPYRTRKPYHLQYGKNQVHSDLRQTNMNNNYQPPPPKTTKTDSCCTIL